MIVLGVNELGELESLNEIRLDMTDPDDTLASPIKLPLLAWHLGSVVA